MSRSGFEPGSAAWKAQTLPRDHNCGQERYHIVLIPPYIKQWLFETIFHFVPKNNIILRGQDNWDTLYNVSKYQFTSNTYINTELITHWRFIIWNKEKYIVHYLYCYVCDVILWNIAIRYNFNLQGQLANILRTDDWDLSHCISIVEPHWLGFKFWTVYNLIWRDFKKLNSWSSMC